MHIADIKFVLETAFNIEAVYLKYKLLQLALAFKCEEATDLVRDSIVPILQNVFIFEQLKEMIKKKYRQQKKRSIFEDVEKPYGDLKRYLRIKI